MLAEEGRDEFEKEVTQLRSQVDQVPAAVQQNGNPVAHIKNERELNEVADLAERRLQFARTWKTGYWIFQKPSKNPAASRRAS